MLDLNKNRLIQKLRDKYGDQYVISRTSKRTESPRDYLMIKRYRSNEDI